MPKGTMRARKPPFLDDEVRASIQLGESVAHAPGKHDYNRRHYATLFMDDGYKTHDDATEIVRALHRAAQRLKVSMNASIEKKTLGGYRVKFRAACKECSKAYVIATYGEDRSRWPYDPRRKLNESDYR